MWGRLLGEMTIRRAAVLVVVLAVAAVAAGYARVAGQSAPDDCSVGTARHVLIPASGERFGAVVVGAGRTGVVLANESTNHDCQWWPLPQYLAVRGYRVLAFNYGRGDKSSEVQAAARYLRIHGAHRLVLIGASIGGAIVIDAAIHLHPAPVAVVSLSAVPEATSYPFPRDARRLNTPIFQIGSTKDPHTRQGADTVELYRASPSPAKRLLLVPGTTHGVHLVNAEAGNKIRDAISAFMRAHTPG